VLATWAQAELRRAAGHGQTVLLSLDQTDLGHRMAVLMVSVRGGGQHRVRRAAPGLGAGADLVTGGGQSAVIGGSFLSFGGLIRMAEAARWGLPVARQRQSGGGYRHEPRGHHRRTGARGQRALSVWRASVRRRGIDELGHSSRSGPSGAVDHRHEQRTDTGGGARLWRAWEIEPMFSDFKGAVFSWKTSWNISSAWRG
jgi:hypothetical protein